MNNSCGVPEWNVFKEIIEYWATETELHQPVFPGVSNPVKHWLLSFHFLFKASILTPLKLSFDAAKANLLSALTLLFSEVRILCALTYFTSPLNIRLHCTVSFFELWNVHKSTFSLKWLHVNLNALCCLRSTMRCLLLRFSQTTSSAMPWLTFELSPLFYSWTSWTCCLLCWLHIWSWQVDSRMSRKSRRMDRVKETELTTKTSVCCPLCAIIHSQDMSVL